MAAVAQHFEAFKTRLDKVLHEKNKVTDVLEKIEQKTGIRRLYVVIALAVLLAVYLMIGYGADFLCNLIGFLYPAYASVKAIESHDKEDDTKWLTYWVVYSVFSLLEFFFDIFLFWIPFYWFLKCAFLVWCFLPVSWNGSHMIYYRFIRPFILRHQDRIDAVIDEAGTAISEVFDFSSPIIKDPFSQAANILTQNVPEVASEAFSDYLAKNVPEEANQEFNEYQSENLPERADQARDIAEGAVTDEIIRRAGRSTKDD